MDYNENRSGCQVRSGCFLAKPLNFCENFCGLFIFCAPFLLAFLGQIGTDTSGLITVVGEVGKLYFLRDGIRLNGTHVVKIVGTVIVGHQSYRIRNLGRKSIVEIHRLMTEYELTPPDIPQNVLEK